MQGIKENRMEDMIFDINFCQNGCIRGSGVDEDGVSAFERQRRIKNYSRLETKPHVDT